MVISLAQFSLVIQAICYIVQSSAEDCEIPLSGITCKDSNTRNTIVSFSGGERLMWCSDNSNPDVEWAELIDLEPSGIGEFCDEFFLIFKGQSLYISRTPPTQISPLEQGRKFAQYSLGHVDSWMVFIRDVRRSDTTYENVHYNFPIDETLLSLHISFSMAYGVWVPSFYQRHDIQQTSHPFKIRLAGYQKAVLNVAHTSIRGYADSFKWVIGYEHLQQHEFIFYKKNDGLHIVLVVEGTHKLADSFNNAATLLNRMHW